MDAGDTHIEHMREALGLAERGLGRVSPNPMVGALVIDRAGAVLGTGWYVGPRGAPHAEVLALREAGDRASGATLYCTLEPCDHHASTPPCTDAVIAAGVARVVVAASDPNPLVDGRGVARLRAAGIEVTEGVLADEARRLNAAFERHITTGLPFVVWKVAASLDGKTAAHDGTARWITSAEARADDPRLTVRASSLAEAWQPTRVVVDSSGGVDPGAAVFDDGAPTVVATTSRTPEASVRGWESAGAEVIVLEADRSGGVSPTALIAPIVVAGADAHGVAAGPGFAPIDAARRLTYRRIDRVGPDLRVEADVHRDR